MLRRYDEAVLRSQTRLAQAGDQGGFDAIYARDSLLRAIVGGHHHQVFTLLPALLSDAQRIGLTVART